MDKKKSTKTCKHNKVEQIGYWDGMCIPEGEPTCGPIVRCKLCSKKFNLTWEEWNKIPKKKKVLAKETTWMKKQNEKIRKAIEAIIKNQGFAKKKPKEHKFIKNIGRK